MWESRGEVNWGLMSPEEQDAKEQEDYEHKKQQAEVYRRRGFRNHLTRLEQAKPGRRDVREAHTDQTLKLGFGKWKYDTGAEVTPQQSAFLAGAEDQVGDVWRGVAQIMKEAGIADFIDTDVQDQREDLMRQLYGDAYLGLDSKIGAVMGAVAEPAGLLMPIMKAKKLSTAFMGSAALGAAYGSALYIDKDESRMVNAAVSSLLMGTVGAGFHKYINQAVGSDVAKLIDDVVEEEAKIIPGFGKDGQTYTRAEFEASLKGGGRKNRKGQKQGRKGKALRGEEKVVVPPTKPSTPQSRKQKKAEKQAETLDELAVAASMNGRKHNLLGRLWGKTKDTGQTVGTLLNRAMQPIYDNLYKYSPKVAAKLRDTDGLQHILKRGWEAKTKEWTRWFQKDLNSAGRLRIHKAINNGGFSKATMQAVRELGGEKAVAEARKVQGVMKEIHASLKEAGYKVGHIPNYHPNMVKDLDKLVKKQQTQVERMLSREKARLGGKPLTQNQKAHISERMFTFDIRFSNTSGSLQTRKKMNIADEDLQYYHDPVTSLHNYIASMSEDIAKRKFFKGFGHKPDKVKGLDPTGSDIDRSIDSLMDLIKKEVPDMAKQDEMVGLLRARFGADVHKTHRFVQAAKNLSYAGTLGNWWSAMTQMGDLVFAFHKYGIRNAVGALLGKRVTTKEMLGIDKAMTELLSGPGVTNKIADWAFKWSGFSRIDKFGKDVNINASLRLNKRLATKDKAKFKAKWGDHFGEYQTEALRVELSNLKLTKDAYLSDNAYLMLWNDLADTQPIGLSEMPKWYLANPNGRVAYAYKTFAMKQFNYMRNSLMRGEGNAAQRAYDMTYFGAMFVMANTGIDKFKAYMGGQDLSIEDAALDNLYTLGLTSKYAVEKSRGLGEIIAQTIMPVPYTQGQDALDSISSGGTGLNEIINQLPIAGAANRKGFMDYAGKGFIGEGIKDMVK